MNATSDPTSGAPMASGIAARRHHSSLPAFQLPNNNRGNYTSLGSVLTPPTLGAGEHTSQLSSINTNTNNNVTGAPGGFSSPQNYWTTSPTTNSTAYAYGSTSNAPQSYSSATSLSQTANLGYRNPYSPGGSSSLNRVNSRPSSPSTNNIVGTQSYESSTQFTAPTGIPSMGQGSLQHQYTGGFPVSSGPSPSVNSHSQTSHDMYSTHSSLPPPTPSHSYYSQPPTFSNSSSSTALSMPSNQPTSINRSLTSPPYPHHSPIHPAPPHIGLQRYTLGHMGSMPVHYPGIVGLHPGMPQQERPFKCDQCPQSFNRNHDLKRHKRIHLAVKPFPCDNCEKSFSRKDALKRHRLVKGCGKVDRSGAATGDSTAESPKLSRNPGSPNSSVNTPIGQIPPRSLSANSPTQIGITDRH